MRVFLLILGLPLVLACQDIENGWKDIKPLLTNRTAVEKLLGNPRVDDNGYYGYSSNETFIQVNYSTKPCAGDQYNRGRYIISKDTVLDYTVTLKIPIRLSELNFNRELFTKDTGDHLSNVFYLNNRDAGIMITVFTQLDAEYVGSIQFRPTKSDAEKFKCTGTGASIGASKVRTCLVLE